MAEIKVITRDMKIKHSLGEWSLEEAMDEIKRRGLTRLLRDAADISENVFLFLWAVNRGETPTTGQVLAAWHEAIVEELEVAYWEKDEITKRQYTGRTAAVRALVLRKN